MSDKIIIHIDWDTFGKLAQGLVAKIKDSGFTFDGVYGIPRGGLPLAVIMSHHLNLPLLVRSTTESLVVDDISDEGTTLSTIKHKKIATLITTPWTQTKPDFCMESKVKRDSWVVFPWENLETEGQ